MNKGKLDQYFETRSKLELIEHIKKSANNLFKLAKIKEKAVNREFENNLGASRALGTTLYAKAEIATEQYNNCEEELIYIIKNILPCKI